MKKRFIKTNGTKCSHSARACTRVTIRESDDMTSFADKHTVTADALNDVNTIHAKTSVHSPDSANRANIATMSDGIVEHGNAMLNLCNANHASTTQNLANTSRAKTSVRSPDSASRANIATMSDGIVEHGNAMLNLCNDNPTSTSQSLANTSRAKTNLQTPDSASRANIATMSDGIVEHGNAMLNLCNTNPTSTAQNLANTSRAKTNLQTPDSANRANIATMSDGIVEHGNAMLNLCNANHASTTQAYDNTIRKTVSVQKGFSDIDKTIDNSKSVAYDFNSMDNAFGNGINDIDKTSYNGKSVAYDFNDTDKTIGNGKSVACDTNGIDNAFGNSINDIDKTSYNGMSVENGANDTDKTIGNGKSVAYDFNSMDNAFDNGDSTANGASRFDGKRAVYVAFELATRALSVLSLFTLYPALYYAQMKWQYSHTVIDGSRLRFTANIWECYSRHLLWALLCAITLFIYVPFVAGARRKWLASRVVIEGALFGESALKRDLVELMIVNVYSFAVQYGTLGILKPRAIAVKTRFLKEHTFTSGKPLSFGGSSKALAAKWVLWAILRALSLGIFTIFEDYAILEWETHNTSFENIATSDNSATVNFFIKHKTTALIVASAIAPLVIIAAIIAFIFSV